MVHNFQECSLNFAVIALKQYIKYTYKPLEQVNWQNMYYH